MMRLEVKHLNKTYQTLSGEMTVLKNINFSLREGEWLTVIGRSGSGKTTLLKCIAGLIPVDQGSIIQYGTISVHEAKEKELQEYRRNYIGFIYQDYQLFPQFTCELNVMLPLIPFVEKEKLLVRARELLERVHLSHRLHHFPAQLSGGEKQRVAIARALLNKPKLLLCDEPTGNLDVNARDEIMGILQELNNDGTSIILVTHDRELMSFGDNILELH